MKNKLFLVLIVILTMLLICVFCFGNVNNNNHKNNDDIFNDEILNQTSDKILNFNGWVGAKKIKVKEEPSESGEIIGEFSFNEEVTYKIYNSKWFIVKYNGNDAYISSQYILDERVNYDSYDEYYLNDVIGYKKYSLAENTGFKSYMDYRTITAKDSKQYRLQAAYAKTGDYGIRMVNDRYCVAVGSHFTRNVGQYFDIILENGVVIPCILADQKADKDTDYDNITTMHNGCVSEFVVDSTSLDKNAKRSGDISSCTNEWDNKISSIKVYNKNIFDK